MSRTVSTWSCERCGTAAFAEQNFCRRCGTPRPQRTPAPVTAQIPAIVAGREPPSDPLPKRSMSGLGLVLVALLFLIFGAFAALLMNDVRNDEPNSPSPTTVTTPGPSNRSGGQFTTTTG